MGSAPHPIHQRRYPSNSQSPPPTGRAFSGIGGIQRGCGPCLPTYYDARERQKIRPFPANLPLKSTEIVRPVSSRQWLSEATAQDSHPQGLAREETTPIATTNDTMDN